jgi:hypothetical protein
MNARTESATLAARIYASFPLAQPSFLRLLRLLDIEATDEVPTAAVTMGGRSRLLLNPTFVAAMCPADHDLVMLVLHELQHVALGHTRLFPRLTPALNWAFDCVINAQLCRLYPEPHHTALFRRCYRPDQMPEALLRPPEGWCTRRQRWLRGRAGAVHRALYSDASVTYTDLYRLTRTSTDCCRRWRRTVATAAPTCCRNCAYSATTRGRAHSPTSRRTSSARCVTSSPSGRW